jgi:hypothetical protein
MPGAQVTKRWPFVLALELVSSAQIARSRITLHRQATVRVRDHPQKSMPYNYGVHAVKNFYKISSVTLPAVG